MISEEKIRFAVNELNTIVSPPIDENDSIDNLNAWIERVLGAKPPVLEPTDVFHPTTMEVLAHFQNPENEDGFAEFAGDSLINQIRSAKKLRELKDIVNVNEELKIMRGTLGKFTDIEALRDKMISILTAVKAEIPVAEVEPQKILIKTAFRDACPKLSEQEYADLEKLILKDKKVLQPLLLWNDTLVDGHNRYEIALKHNIPFTTEKVLFKDDKEVIIWIKENAISQRNLTDYAKYELIKDIEGTLREKAKKRQSLAGKGIKTDEPKQSVREEMAEKIDVSPSQLRKMKKFDEKAPAELKEKVRKGKVKIGTALKSLVEKEPHPVLSDAEKVEYACRELDKWIIKYQEDELFKEFTERVTDVTVDMREKYKI